MDGNSQTVSGIVYKITNLINDKIYIGQTICPLDKRFREHCYPSRKYYSSIGKAIQKHGKENFKVEQIDSASTVSELNEKETYWIKTLNALTPVGYNLKSAGEGHGVETKEARINKSSSSYNKPTKLGYKGIIYSENEEKYYGDYTSRVDNVHNIFTGYFIDIMQAVICRDIIILLINGHKDALNFPNKTIDELLTQLKEYPSKNAMKLINKKFPKFSLEKNNRFIKVTNGNVNNPPRNGYKGMCYRKPEQTRDNIGYFYTIFKYNLKIYYCGKYQNKINAAITYDIYARIYRPNIGTFNFKETNVRKLLKMIDEPVQDKLLELVNEYGG